MTLSEEASARIPRSLRRPCLSVQRNRCDPSYPVRRVTVNSTVRTIDRPLTPWDRFGAGSNRYISELLSHVNAKSTAGSRLAPLGPSNQRNPGDPSYTLDVSPRYFDGAWSSHAQTRRHRPLSHRAILLTRGVPTTFPGHGPDRSCSVPDPQAVRTVVRPLAAWDCFGVD